MKTKWKEKVSGKDIKHEYSPRLSTSHFPYLQGQKTFHLNDSNISTRIKKSLHNFKENIYKLRQKHMQKVSWQLTENQLVIK